MDEAPMIVDLTGRKSPAPSAAKPAPAEALLTLA
jgi:hypothetical protein